MLKNAHSLELTGVHAAKYRNRSDQQSARKQWSGVARGLKFVISVQGNDWERFLYLVACNRCLVRHCQIVRPRVSLDKPLFFRRNFSTFTLYRGKIAHKNIY